MDFKICEDTSHTYYVQYVYKLINCIQITLSPFSPGSPGFPDTPWKNNVEVKDEHLFHSLKQKSQMS